MASTNPKQRMVLYVSREHAGRCIQLARKYGTSRSDVVRLALDRGLDLIVPQLRRAHAERLESALDGGAAVPVALPSAAAGADAADQLREYAQTLRQVSGPRAVPELRGLLTVQAKVLRVPPHEVEDVVEEVLSSLPSEEMPAGASAALVNPHEPPD